MGRVLFIVFTLGAVVSWGQSGFNVRLLDHWTGGQTDPHSLRFFDVVSYSGSNGTYAFTADRKKVYVLRVEDDRLSLVHEHPLADTMGFHDFRDLKVFDHYLLVSGATGGVDVFDLADLPDSITSVHVTPHPQMQMAHNLTVDHERGLVWFSNYATGELTLAKLHLPDSVSYLRSYALTPHDCTVHDSLLYVYDLYDGFRIYDATNPMSLVLLGHMDSYVERGATHSGAVVSEDIHILVDENPGYGIKVVDVSQPSSARVTDLHYVDTDYSDATPHNVKVRDDLVFVSHYTEGLQVFRIIGDQLELYGHYHTFQGDKSQAFYLSGAWGVELLDNDRVLVSDRGAGVFLLEVGDAGMSSPVDELTLFPNPMTEGELTVALPSDFTLPYDMEVLDSRGKTLLVKKSLNLHWERISAKLPTGVYLLKVESSDGTTVVNRFVVH